MDPLDPLFDALQLFDPPGIKTQRPKPPREALWFAAFLLALVGVGILVWTLWLR